MVEDEYIVVLKKDQTDDTLDRVSTACFSKNVWKSLPGFKGFSARLSAAELAEVLKDEAVDYVESNQVVRAIGLRASGENWMDQIPAAKDACSAAQTGSQSWGQSRTTRLSGTGDFEHEPSWGSNVNVYVIDTGTACEHEDFRGDCACGPDFGTLLGQPLDGCADGQGHGSHCSSTATGSVYGIAKNATVIGVKVLSNLGAGSTAGVVSGMDWVAEQGPGSVASMSLGGGACSAMDAAVESMVAAGVTVVVAAGNENQDACNVSPARSDAAITVGATTESDGRSIFSNYGPCCDIFAPGSNILAASNRPGSTQTLSGTSMAAPHVAGAAAAILSENPSFSPAQVKAALVDLALDDVISNVGTGSPNKLLHLEC